MKPRAGDRITYRPWSTGTLHHGTVVQRTRGEQWQLLVRWDSAPQDREYWLVDAWYHYRQGRLAREATAS